MDFGANEHVSGSKERVTLLQDVPLSYQQLRDVNVIDKNLDANLSRRGDSGLMVKERHFPDQSVYILFDQLSHLKKQLNRLNFYLGELEDLIP